MKKIELIEKRTRYARSDIISAIECLDGFSETRLSDLESKIFEAAKNMREARTQIEAARHELMVLERNLKERGLI